MLLSKTIHWGGFFGALLGKLAVSIKLYVPLAKYIQMLLATME